jgi:hypothetical protein
MKSPLEDGRLSRLQRSSDLAIRIGQEAFQLQAGFDQAVVSG